MRSSAMRWVVGGAVALCLIGLSFKAADLFGPAPPSATVDGTASVPTASRSPASPPTPAVPPSPATGDAGAAPAADAGGQHEIAEPLDTVHALVGDPAPRTRLGSAAAKNRRSAVGAGPRARRKSTPRAAYEADLRGPLGPSGSGAILPGAAPGERAAPGVSDAPDGIVFDSGDTAYATDKKVAVADVQGVAAGTVSFWLQPQWDQGNQDDAAFIAIGDALQVVKNVDYLRFEALKGGTVTSGVGAPIAAWKDGEWHQVAATWEGDQLALYFDGNLVSRQQRVPPIQLADNAQLFVGSSYPAGRPVAPGVIGQVGLENHPLSPRDVQQRFLKTIGE
jgi:hypothetical protein